MSARVPTTIRPYMLYEERTDLVSEHSHAPVKKITPDILHIWHCTDINGSSRMP